MASLKEWRQGGRSEGGGGYGSMGVRGGGKSELNKKRESWMARLIKHLLVCVCGGEEQRREV